MNPEMEKPRITEIKVRMDCNGCVQKIKKVLHGVTGIYDYYVDFPQQKITIIGRADLGKIAKAIKKTRKSAVICSHTEQSDQQGQQTGEPVPEGGTDEAGAPPPESTEQLQTEAAQPAEAQNEQPPPPSPDNPPPPPPDNPPPESVNDTKNQSTQTSKPKDSEEIHAVSHHPPDYGHRYPYGHYFQQDNGAQWQPYPSGQGFGGEPSQLPQPVYVTHSYNTYKPSPYVTEYYNGNSYSTYKRSPYATEYYNGNSYSTYKPSPYATEYYNANSYNTHQPSPYVTEYAHPQASPGYSYYSRPDNYNYSQVYYNGSNDSGNGNGNITSMFSEENPNACTIV